MKAFWIVLVIASILILGTINSALAASDGTVKSFQKISDTAGGFTATLDDDDIFGNSVTSIGDIDGDGITDLAVGAEGDDDGGTDKGAVYILFLEPLCDVPSIGLMDITSSCVISSDATAPENVLVRNGAVMTIESGVTFDIDFAKFNLTVKSGSGVLIKAGEKIT